LRLLYFAAKIGRRHSVRFVANDEVPIRRRLQFGLQLGRTRGHVEPHDETILFNEWIASDGSFNLITGQDVEAEAKFLGHLVLPLLDKASGRDDQTALEVAADQEFLDEQPCHDGLAGTRIVGKQEAQRLTWKHLAVNGCDLVR
jgi:hypothetical protein